MRKVLVLILILAIGCTALSNIAGFFESIPKPVKTLIGVGVAILGVSWAYTWFFDPIVILVENPFGAVSFGPFIVFDQKNWAFPQNWVWNHEYSHYCQYAFFGPAMLPLYLLSAGYSLLTTGNIWDANPWETASMNDPSPPSWEPQFIFRFGDGYE